MRRRGLGSGGRVATAESDRVDSPVIPWSVTVPQPDHGHTMTTADSAGPAIALPVGDAAPNPVSKAVRWSYSALIADLGALAVAALVSLGVNEWRSGPQIPHVWTIALFVLTPALVAAHGGYSPSPQLDLVDRLRQALGRLLFAGLFVIAAWAMTTHGPVSTESAVVTWAIFAVALAGVRIALHAHASARRRHTALRPTLIVGAGRVGSAISRRLLDHPEYGLVPVGYLDDDPLIPGGDGVPVLGKVRDLEPVVQRYEVRQVIITFSRASHEQLLMLTERAVALGLDISLVPRLYQKTTQRVTVRHIGGMPLLDLRFIDPEGLEFRIKYALDKVGATFALVLMSPILAVSMAAVWMTMGRPVLFRQTRVGRDGKEFEMLKLRTMIAPNGHEAIDLPADMAPGGIEGAVDRTTRVGRLLRRLSIDELPQLVNVLTGEMSLVGPRPERPEFVRLFNSNVDGYGRRHRVKAGITGWAQVHGLRGRTSISDRAEWDNYYIDNFSLWLDAKIVVLTACELVVAVLSPTRNSFVGRRVRHDGLIQSDRNRA
jgi:exopolysaccharide biosynthesis polyprenyl glycosylphosphotransferase